MRKMHLFLVLAGVAVFVVAPVGVMADYYDSFSDRAACGPDPNYASCNPALLFGYFDANYSWHIDNPQWWYYPLMAASGSWFDANSASLRVLVTGGTILPTLGISAMVPDNGDQDPCTSPAYWDDTTNHYILARVKYPGAYLPPPYGDKRNDPNFDRGVLYIFMHGDPDTWTSLGFNFTLHTCAYKNGDPNLPIGFERQHYWTEHLNLNYTSGANMYNIQRLWIDPNGLRPYNSLDPNLADPNDTTHLTPPETYGSGPDNRIESMDNTKWLGWDYDTAERNGCWMLCQFEIDPNYQPGDPNGKWLKGAVWEGDKYDWDGEWMLNWQLSDEWWDGSTYRSYSYPAVAQGRCGFVTLSAEPALWGAGFPGAGEYDDVEARTDVFNGIARKLTLNVGHSNWMQSMTIDPIADPRYDPNDPNNVNHLELRYTDGTPIVLTATPISGKSFKEWTIYDPNYPGDVAYATSDSNATIYLTMNADYQVDANFKCGSGLPPFVAVALLALGAGLVIRRMW